MLWRRKPIFEFITPIDGMDKVCPIIPARDLKHAWLARAATVAGREAQCPRFEIAHSSSVARCPGIRHLMREGYIIRAWQDILITVTDDTITWKTPADQAALGFYEAVEFHPASAFADYFDDWPLGWEREIVKFIVPWYVRIPPGWRLLMTDVAYCPFRR